ncbi:MAG: hypothetical protein WDW38_006299 [Sanguina aurantia]
MILVLLSFSTASALDGDCQALSDQYLDKHHKEASPHTGKNMVYFLHVPRTAGRTLHSCFLKTGTPPRDRCPKAYDHLRINVTVPQCRLLSSHDDFSVVSMLTEDVAVLTHLRDPVDRVVSAYEFAVEVSARMLNRPRNFKKRGDKIATEDVWPWSYLVPFFVQDLRARVRAVKSVPQPETGNWIYVESPEGERFYYNRIRNVSKWNLTAEEEALRLPELNQYDNELVMPLKDFVAHPIAKELIHNGAAFQVLGITNYSHWGDAGRMRGCVWDDTATHAHLLGVAQRRVQRFMHVGTTDRLSESVSSAAAALHMDLESPGYGGDEENTAVRVAESQAADISALDLPVLAKVVRTKRIALQSSQKELYTASQDPKLDVEVDELKRTVNEARVELREAQTPNATRPHRTAGATSCPCSVVSLRLTCSLPVLTQDLSEVRFACDTPPPTAPNSPIPVRVHIFLTLTSAHTSTDPVLSALSLGVSYQQCAQRAQARSAQRRDQSLTSLSMPDGRVVAFSKQARRGIDPAVVLAIKAQNQLDTALHHVGLSMLDTHRAEFLTAGTLKDMAPIAPLKLPMMEPRKNRFQIPRPEAEQGSDEL